jgi:hypothetical protein
MIRFATLFPYCLMIACLCLGSSARAQDCNQNGLPDNVDILIGLATDCNSNQVPDWCEGDCNGNCIPDEIDISSGTSTDCNFDGLPDECRDCNGNQILDSSEISGGFISDNDFNGIPDLCDGNDCNDNSLPDAIEIAFGASLDCDGNGVPDECEADCNNNGVADSVDISSGTSTDCNNNSLPDECEYPDLDCNTNGLIDGCDLFLAMSSDCNLNGIPDECDITTGSSDDCNGNGIPDDCEQIGDCNRFGAMDWDDCSAGNMGFIDVSVSGLSCNLIDPIQTTDLSRGAYSGAPLGANQEVANYSVSSDWQVTLSAPVPYLRVYLKTWRGSFTGGNDPAVLYDFSQPFRIVSGLENASVSGQTLVLDDDHPTRFHSGIIEFENLSSLSVNVSTSNPSIAPSGLQSFTIASSECPATGPIIRDTIFVDQSVASSPNCQLGNSWNTAFSDLETALAQARPGDDIWVAAGEYSLEKPEDPNLDITFGFRLVNQVSVYGGFIGNEDMLSQRDPNANPTILTVDPKLSTSIISAIGTNSTAVLDGFTLRSPSAPPGAVQILNNPFGTCTIRNCILETDAEGYLSLHPDPATNPPLLQDNLIRVTVDPLRTCGIQAAFLECRSLDLLCGPGTANDSCGSDLFDATDFSNYEQVFDADPWVIDELIIQSGARLNLTNRPSFDFNPGSSTPEALYVRNLVIETNAVLNTGLNAVYAENVNVVTRDEDVPVLGFSLINIDMDCDEEYNVRVRSDDGTEPNEPLPTVYGEVFRDGGSNFGVMVMDTMGSGSANSYPVIAHGSFARANEAAVIVTFEYDFIQDDAGDAILFVSLTDSPNIDRNTNRRVAQITAPQQGAPGGVDDPNGDMITFWGIFPRGVLNFTRGTYVQLELVSSGNARVAIDNFDPTVECGEECLDLTGQNGVDRDDLIVWLANVGERITTETFCADAPFSQDNYIINSDIISQDVGRLLPDTISSCSDGVSAAGTLNLPESTASGVTLQPQTSLLVAAKADTLSNTIEDYLYELDSSGVCLGSLRPASVPDPNPTKGYLANTRFVRAPNDELYQLHGLQGLIRLSDGLPVIPSQQFTTQAGETVYVGVTLSNDQVFGVPLVDVAFDPVDPNFLYVAPVVIEPVGFNPFTNPRYRATARLRMDNGTYAFDQIIGVDPAVAPESNNVTLLNPNAELRDYAKLTSVRLLEVDQLGNLYVLSAFGVDNNTYIHRYERGTWTETRTNVSSVIDGAGGMIMAELPASSGQGTSEWLFLASAISNANASSLPGPRDGTLTKVAAYELDPNGTPQLVGTSTIDVKNATGLMSDSGRPNFVIADLALSGGNLVAVGTAYDRDAFILGQLTGQPVIASVPLPFVPDAVVDATLLDFCGDLSAHPIALISVKRCQFDVNGDGTVNGQDGVAIADSLGTVGPAPRGPFFPADVNVDQTVDIKDVKDIQIQIEQNCP